MRVELSRFFASGRDDDLPDPCHRQRRCISQSVSAPSAGHGRNSAIISRQASRRALGSGTQRAAPDPARHLHQQRCHRADRCAHPARIVAPHAGDWSAARPLRDGPPPHQNIAPPSFLDHHRSRAERDLAQSCRVTRECRARDLAAFACSPIHHEWLALPTSFLQFVLDLGRIPFVAPRCRSWVSFV